jgi:hypothetical protein
MSEGGGFEDQDLAKLRQRAEEDLLEANEQRADLIIRYCKLPEKARADIVRYLGDYDPDILQFIRNEGNADEFGELIGRVLNQSREFNPRVGSKSGRSYLEVRGELFDLESVYRKEKYDALGEEVVSAKDRLAELRAAVLLLRPLYGGRDLRQFVVRAFTWMLTRTHVRLKMRIPDWLRSLIPSEEIESEEVIRRAEEELHEKDYLATETKERLKEHPHMDPLIAERGARVAWDELRKEIAEAHRKRIPAVERFSRNLHERYPDFRTLVDLLLGTDRNGRLPV